MVVRVKIRDKFLGDQIVHYKLGKIQGAHRVPRVYRGTTGILLISIHGLGIYIWAVIVMKERPSLSHTHAKDKNKLATLAP